jgi:hypothetical protein
MNPPILLCLLFGLACGAETALAMPKAAENEAAQVSRGADVSRPKASAKPGKSPASQGRRTGATKPPCPAKAQHGGTPGTAPTPC